MEKRLFLAFFLSFIVLYAWGILAGPKIDPNKSQIYANKEVTKKSNGPPSLTSSIPSNEITEVQRSEETYLLESKRLALLFSNKGAQLKTIYVKDYKFSLPLRNYAGIEGFEDTLFDVQHKSDKNIVFIYKSASQILTKSYNISDNDFTVAVNIIVENISEMSNLAQPILNGFTIDILSLGKTISGEEANGLHRFEIDKDVFHERDKTLFEYLVYADQGIDRKGSAYKFKPAEGKNVLSKVNWAGFRSRYFCSLIKPHFDTGGYTFDFVDENTLSVKIKPSGDPIKPGERLELNSVIFTGPEKLELLSSYGYGFEKVRKYYRFGLFDFAGKAIYSLLHFLHKIIPSWGTNIVLICLIIYGVTYPFTLQSMLSMRKMQALSPKINELKEKYKDNPQKMNTELMEVYKKNKINPLGGCLPILFQMPIFIGLYQVLWRSVEFVGVGFLWIADLTKPDRLFTFKQNLPIIGNELNILPLIMVLIMFFQQKFSSKNMNITDPQQLAQQKMMTTVMPIMLGFIFYRMASGLTLYFTCFYILSTISQWKMSKINIPTTK